MHPPPPQDLPRQGTARMVRQREDLLGHCSHLEKAVHPRSSDPQPAQITKGTSKHQKTATIQERSYDRQLGENSGENAGEYRTWQTSNIARGNWHQVHQQLQSLLQKRRTKTESKGNPQVQSGDLNIFSKRPTCCTTYRVKLKNTTNGQMPDAPEGKCKIYGRRIRLAGQTWEGPHWKA